MTPLDGIPLAWQDQLQHSGYLAEAEGHRIWWADFGQPDRMRFVVLHGGPGSGSNFKTLSFFDPALHRVIFLDQRGTGRSLPAGELRGNTSLALVADLERLREHLGVDRWHVFGGSWGATLGLVYAQFHPQACLSLILRGVSNRPDHQTQWLLQRRPKVDTLRHEAFLDGLDGAARLDPVGARLAQITSGDLEKIAAATRAVVSLEAGLKEAISDHAAMVKAAANFSPEEVERAKIYLHFWHHRSFLPDGLLFDTAAIATIPSSFLHGEKDLICPLDGAERIVQQLPHAALQVIPGEGHSPFQPKMARALGEAVHRAGLGGVQSPGPCH